jgi:beta-lactam-binding protein with PASTA domain
MQLSNAVALISLLTTTAFAQRVVIQSPADGSTVTAGSNINVVIARPVCHLVMILSTVLIWV